MKLSLNCSLEYQKLFLSIDESEKLYRYLIGLNKLKEMAIIESISGEIFHLNYGKLMFITDTMYDEGKFPESIWGNTMIWSKEMKSVKKRVEKHIGMNFETCVCIYYPDGNSGVDFHSDPSAFGDTTIIPSISLGEERDFLLREKSTLKEHKLTLNNGSLVIMGENCQNLYEHSLPINPIYKKGRINLTFRKYGFDI